MQQFGKQVLFITGVQSFVNTESWQKLRTQIGKQGFRYKRVSIESEPSPNIIDGIVRQFSEMSVDMVVAIGGGSVLDAGKAISAMLNRIESVVEYLEDIGSKVHDGRKIPFIAVPTTSGTGSEATKNAVISKVGKNGFKKSLRHNAFVPNIALVDPELTLTTPFSVTAACGMDALTQLIESFVSTQASPMTDALDRGAFSVLENALVLACIDRPNDIELRCQISYAAYVSGLTLANAGLGLIHGFASIIGGKFNIPHGVICGTLLAPVCRSNIETMINNDSKNIALKKYGEIANFLDPSNQFRGHKEGEKAHHLVSILEAWTTWLKIPNLGIFGVTFKDVDRIINEVGLKNNPIQLSDRQLIDILKSRL